MGKFIENKELSGDNKALREYMNNLTIARHREVVRNIKQYAGVSSACLLSWKSKQCRIPVLTKMIMEEIFGEKVFPDYDKPNIKIELL